jgi:flagellar hook assembly protein FlgD
MEATNVTVKIYNVEGKEIKTLINNEEQAAGSYQLAFDGSPLPSGTYYCYLTIGNHTSVQKLVLSK